MSKQNESNTCSLGFTVTHPFMELTCSKELFHDGPHYDEYQQYLWGHLDQTKDPWVEARRRKYAEAKAKRDSRRRWRRGLAQDFTDAFTLRGPRA